MVTPSMIANDNSQQAFDIIPHDHKRSISVTGRSTAVRRAKTLSNRSSRPVRVERSDGRVKMEFLSGGIVRYQRRTH